MKSRKKLVLLLSMIATMMILALPVHAASAKKIALKAYKDYLEKKINWAGPEGGRDGWKIVQKATHFAVVYLDNDDVPELLVRNMKSKDCEDMGFEYERVMCYQKKKVKKAGSVDSTGHCTKYYRKTGVIIVPFEYMDIYKGIIYDYFDGSKAKLTRIGSSYKENGAQHYSGGSGEIKKSAFTKLLRKYTKGKKAEKIKWYANTPSNRKKYLK